MIFFSVQGNCHSRRKTSSVESRTWTYAEDECQIKRREKQCIRFSYFISTCFPIKYDANVCMTFFIRAECLLRAWSVRKILSSACHFCQDESMRIDFIQLDRTVIDDYLFVLVVRLIWMLCWIIPNDKHHCQSKINRKWLGWRSTGAVWTRKRGNNLERRSIPFSRAFLCTWKSICSNDNKTTYW